jgi:zeaxanthin glucosyltransferase
MVRFAIVCPDATGHLSPMLALGHEMQRCGHCITGFTILLGALLL